MRISLMLLLLAASAPVAAHIVAVPDKGVAGSYQAVMLRVGHGCGAAATTSISVELPAGLSVVRPQPKAGWTLAVETVPPVAAPAGQGRAATGRVTRIIWSGLLPAGQFDDFGLLLKLPPTIGPLTFPIVQRCGSVEERWDGPFGGRRPAPVLTVEPADAQGEHHH